MILELIIGISVVVNLVLWFLLINSDDCTDLKVETERLKMENIILNREKNKMSDLFEYVIDKDVHIDKSNDEMVIIYKKQEDDLKEIIEEGLGIK